MSGFYDVLPIEVCQVVLPPPEIRIKQHESIELFVSVHVAARSDFAERLECMRVACIWATQGSLNPMLAGVGIHICCRSDVRLTPCKL